MGLDKVGMGLWRRNHATNLLGFFVDVNSRIDSICGSFGIGIGMFCKLTRFERQGRKSRGTMTGDTRPPPVL